MTLREIRKERGVSQAELAIRCDVSAAHICKVEKGGADISISLARKIANVLNITYFDVLAAVECSQRERFKHIEENNKTAETVTVEFNQAYIEKLIKDSHKLQVILDGLYANAQRSNTRDDSIFFSIGSVNAVLKAADGERYFDELERLESE